MIFGMPSALVQVQRRTLGLQVRGAAALNLPIYVTEQYPKALGATVSEIKEVLPKSAPVIAKTKFSMIGAHPPYQSAALKCRTACVARGLRWGPRRAARLGAGRAGGGRTVCSKAAQ